MKIDRAVYKYIEYELHHYEQYKEEIRAEREAILEASPSPADGMPRGNGTGNPTENKGMRLVESTAMLSMQKIIRAADNAIRQLNPIHEQIFKMYFVQGRKDRYKMCDELHISIETFKRYKRAIICRVGQELGILNALTQS